MKKDKIVNFSDKKLNKEISDLRDLILGTLPEEIHPAEVSKIGFLSVYAGYDILRGLLGLVEEDQQNEIAKISVEEFFNILEEFKHLLEKDYGNINLDLKLTRKRGWKNANK